MAPLRHAGRLQQPATVPSILYYAPLHQLAGGIAGQASRGSLRSWGYRAWLGIQALARSQRALRRCDSRRPVSLDLREGEGVATNRVANSRLAN